MQVRVIGFIPPIVGVDSHFNTFRLGGFYAKHLLPGETVYLLHEKDKIVFGSAVIESIEVGGLGEMLLLHAHKNHTQLDQDPMTAPERLNDVIRKIYGPHIATLTKRTNVIYMKRLE